MLVESSIWKGGELHCVVQTLRGCHLVRSWLTAGSRRSATRSQSDGKTSFSGLQRLARSLYKDSYGSRNLVRRDQLRAGQRAGQAVQRDVPKIRSLPPAFEQDGRSDPSEAGRPHDRRRGALRGHRQGLRDHARALRADHPARSSRRSIPRRHGRSTSRSSSIWPKSTRSTTTTPTTWRPRPAAPRPTGCWSTRCASPGKVGDRTRRAAHQAAAVRAAAHRRGADAEHDAVRRRGARARPPRRARGVEEAEATKRELTMAQQLIESLSAEFEPDQVPRRVPRAGARPDRAQGRRRGDRGPARGRGARGRARPDGGAGGEPRRRRRRGARAPKPKRKSKSEDSDGASGKRRARAKA